MLYLGYFYSVMLAQIILADILYKVKKTSKLYLH